MFKILSEKAGLKTAFLRCLGGVLKVFKKELYFEHYIGGMNFRRKAKTLRPEQIADLLLQHLYKSQPEGGVFLNNFLSGRNIYKDVDILNAVSKLLLEKKLVEQIKNRFSAFTYSLATKHIFGNDPTAVESVDTLGKIELLVAPVVITEKGKYFVNQGQRLDSQGLSEENEGKRKRKERLINFIIAVVTAACVVLVTEPIKQYIADKKAEHKNESSPVRPRIDPRQRPEPGKPVGAVAP